MLQMEYQIKLKAADAKPANASGITSSWETLIESLPELQHGNHLGKVDAKHGLLNALLILRHLVCLWRNRQETWLQHQAIIYR
jgi:hypothetical protein